MKLMSMNCPNCGARLDIDIDNISKYCGKCGSKILLDVEQIQYILAEKEKTKRVEIQEQTKRENNKMEHIGKILCICVPCGIVILFMILTFIIGIMWF